MGTFPTPDEAFDEYLKLYDEGVAADGRVVAAISYAEQFGFNMFDRAHFLTSRLRGAKMVRERVAGLVDSLTDRRCRWRRVGAGGGGGEREEAVMAPYPVAHYPTLPPVGRCSCAPCSRRRRMSVLRAALPAMSGLAAYANAVSVAGRLCEDTPAAKIEKAIALTGAICQMPLAISESLARIGREHRLARDVWADRQRGILKGESLVDPKGTKEIADMLARFKEERGISDEVKPPVVIQTRQLAAEGKVYSGTEVLRGDWPQDEPSMSDALDSMERQIYTQRERPVQMVSAEKFRRLHRMNDDDDR